MDATVLHRILDIQEAARSDPGYQELISEHEVKSKRMLATVAKLPKELQEDVFDYIALETVMHLRMLEIACEM